MHQTSVISLLGSSTESLPDPAMLSCLYLIAALMFAIQSVTSVVFSARKTQEDFWSGEKISKQRAASSPVTPDCLDSRQNWSGRLRESARGEAGGARPLSGMRKEWRLSQPILASRVALRK